MPTPITTWQMLDEVEVTRNFDTKWGSRTATAFGNRYLYEGAGPSEQRTYNGELVYSTEVDAIVAACNTPLSESGSTITIRVHGINWTGKALSCRFSQVLAAGYYNGSVVLDKPTKE